MDKVRFVRNMARSMGDSIDSSSVLRYNYLVLSSIVLRVPHFSVTG